MDFSDDKRSDLFQSKNGNFKDKQHTFDKSSVQKQAQSAANSMVNDVLKEYGQVDISGSKTQITDEKANISANPSNEEYAAFDLFKTESKPVIEDNLGYHASTNDEKSQIKAAQSTQLFEDSKSKEVFIDKPNNVSFSESKHTFKSETPNPIEYQEHIGKVYYDKKDENGNPILRADGTHTKVADSISAEKAGASSAILTRQFSDDGKLHTDIKLNKVKMSDKKASQNFFDAVDTVKKTAEYFDRDEEAGSGSVWNDTAATFLEHSASKSMEKAHRYDDIIDKSNETLKAIKAEEKAEKRAEKQQVKDNRQKKDTVNTKSDIFKDKKTDIFENSDDSKTDIFLKDSDKKSNLEKFKKNAIGTKKDISEPKKSNSKNDKKFEQEKIAISDKDKKTDSSSKKELDIFSASSVVFKDNSNVFLTKGDKDFKDIQKDALGRAKFEEIDDKKKASGKAGLSKKFEKTTNKKDKVSLFEEKKSSNEISIRDKNTVPTVKGDFENATKNTKSTNDYFIDSNKPKAKNREMSQFDKKEQAKSDKKAAKKAKSKELKKAATKTSVAMALRLGSKKMNEIEDVNGNNLTGDLIKDGSSGLASMISEKIMSILKSKLKNAVKNGLKAIFKALIKLIVQLVSLFVQIIVTLFPLFIILILVLAIGMLVATSNDAGNDEYMDEAITDELGGYYQGPTSNNYISPEKRAEIIADMDEMYGLTPTQKKVIRFALRQVGCAYNQDSHWNHNDSVWDCSELAYCSWLQVGVDISNQGLYSAAEEARHLIETNQVATGTLLPGDLIFWGGSNNGRYMGISHVAVYIGNGMMVEARGKSWGVLYCNVRTKGIVAYCRPVY